MKCPKCRAEIISNTVDACPYCGSPLTIRSENNKRIENAKNHETKEIAKAIKEAIEAQKTLYKQEKAEAKKLEKTEKKAESKVQGKVEWKKYSTSDIIILFVSLALTFIVLVITMSLILRR
jgi:flagellar biosynthesis/type III secretory pathway M-ring protein FliF/YscJ